MKQHFYCLKVTLDAEPLPAKLAAMVGRPQPWIDAADTFTSRPCVVNAGMLHRGFACNDGAHRYECGDRGVELVDAHLVPAGFIRFDDSADGSAWEVCRLLDELEGDGRYAVVMRNPNDLSVRRSLQDHGRHRTLLRLYKVFKRV